MALTDLAIKRALPSTKIVKLSDGGGLQLWITPDGAKRWRLAYRFGGAQKTLAIGVYLEVGLKDARDARETARKTLAHGQDPSQAKKAAKLERGGNGYAQPNATAPHSYSTHSCRFRRKRSCLRAFLCSAFDGGGCQTRFSIVRAKSTARSSGMPPMTKWMRPLLDHQASDRSPRRSDRIGVSGA
jgi:hypothetical protein